MKILKITTKLLTFLLVILSSAAFAGFDATIQNSGECFSESGVASGVLKPNIICRGTMAGVRKQTADTGRSAYFLKGIFATGAFWITFQQTVNNKSFQCNPPSTQEWLDIWDTAMTSNAYYWIKMDPNTGICKEMVLMNGSAFKNASAL